MIFIIGSISFSLSYIVGCEIGVTKISIDIVHHVFIECLRQLLLSSFAIFCSTNVLYRGIPKVSENSIAASSFSKVIMCLCQSQENSLNRLLALIQSFMGSIRIVSGILNETGTIIWNIIRYIGYCYRYAWRD